MRHKLGFVLWRRRLSNRLKALFVKSIKLSNLSIYISLVTAMIALYFAFVANKIGRQANKISETQLKMQITDTSQQSQLNKLTEIVEELKTEHTLSNKIYQTTDKLNESNKIQLQIIDQQLKLAERLEYEAQKRDTLEQNANMLSLIMAFNTLFDFKSSSDAYGLYGLPPANRSKVVTRVRQLLESQLQNKYVLNNSYLRYVWFDFYLYLSNLEMDYNIYDLGTRSVIKDEAQHEKLARDFSAKFLDFVNKMLKPKNQFLQMYHEKVFREFIKDPQYRY